MEVHVTTENHLVSTGPALCTALIFNTLLAWVGFTIHYYHARQNAAFVAFVRQHMQLNEDPEFILNAALTVRVPPWELLRSDVFLAGGAVTIVTVLTLAYLARRLRSLREFRGSA